MKYPQLVSTRAVNAISDWLVTRLEQLGVEAPLIYSRLLLSLLQSSVQINDPIEFNNLETFLANRKGSKRYPPCDTDTLKKLAAVQCLMDTVSSEQEINNIENLVDELCDKLIDIEKQIKNEEDHEINETETSTASLGETTASSSETSKVTSEKLTDSEDPRKRYYRAFPALSKEMEDSFRILKRNTKALTWPADRINNSGASSSSTSFVVNSQANNTVLCNTAGVKRKTKRRRNQAMSKGKTGNNIRKNSYGGNCSPTWDTDFEGSWEMGRDLIKEFIVKQNNRNRSTSESAAYNIQNTVNHENCEKRMKPMMAENDAGPSSNLSSQMGNEESLGNAEVVVEASICEDISTLSDNSKTMNATSTYLTADEGYSTHENLTSLSEIGDGSLNTARRLYERDNMPNDSLNISLNVTTSDDFAQFKAKFNSNVEALWKTDDGGGGEIAEATDMNALWTNDVANAETKINANQKNNLENFWMNYYNHHYDEETFGSDSIKMPIAAAPPVIQANIAIADNNDQEYFSMPNYLGNQNKAVGNIGGSIGVNKEKATPIKMFFQDSIWSGNSNKSYSDSDESFYSKAMNSYNKQEHKISQNAAHVDYPYNISKWSEGIDGVPSSVTSFDKQQLITSSSNTSIDSCVSSGCFRRDLPPNEMKSLYLNDYNWQMKSNLSPDSNPMSMPELYATASSSTSMASINDYISEKYPKISLANHSASSGFVEYSRIKPMAGSLIKSANDQQKSVAATDPMTNFEEQEDDEEEENLLTSERTHFNPIKQSYADGHSFHISSNLDDIDYERSESGYFHFESDKYLEYTRQDGLLIEDDASLYSNVSSTTSIDKYGKFSNRSKKNFDFVIKFRLKSTDKCCQTDDLAESEDCGVYSIKTQGRNINKSQRTRDSCDGDDGFNYMSCDDEMKNDTACGNNIDQWSMAEICKKCIDNNNTHTLWGLCPTCNNDIKSMPANRLLKDELNVEADQIMSDLKYMQDLYIGSDWENDDDDEDDTDLDAETIRDCEFYQSISSPDDGDCPSGGDMMDDCVDDQKDILYANVTKIISDLLKPENAKSLANALSSAGGGGGRTMKKIFVEGNDIVEELNNNNDEKYIGGLWSNDENIIWKKEFKPIDILSQLNSNNNNESFLEKHNWEYSNLADLWKKDSSPPDQQKTDAFHSHSPPPSTLPTTTRPYDQLGNCGSKEHINQVDEQQQNANETIFSKNLKNLISLNNISQNQSSFVGGGQNMTECKRLAGFLTQNRNNLKISNRFDRKRRHSASQNINNNNSNACNNNLNNNTAKYFFNRSFDGNNIIFGSKTLNLATTKDTDLANDLSQQQSSATIITCKYWTTLDTATANDINSSSSNSSINNNDNGNNNNSIGQKSFFIDKQHPQFDGLAAIALNPSSILKHVALVSRPLTR